MHAYTHTHHASVMNVSRMKIHIYIHTYIHTYIHISSHGGKYIHVVYTHM
jgi:hypothetical protein